MSFYTMAFFGTTPIGSLIGGAVAEFGNIARRVQVGFVRTYAAMILLGALAVIGYFIYYGLKLVA